MLVTAATIFTAHYFGSCLRKSIFAKNKNAFSFLKATDIKLSQSNSKTIFQILNSFSSRTFSFNLIGWHYQLPFVPKNRSKSSAKMAVVAFHLVEIRFKMKKFYSRRNQVFAVEITKSGFFLFSVCIYYFNWINYDPIKLFGFIVVNKLLGKFCAD